MHISSNLLSKKKKSFYLSCKGKHKKDEYVKSQQNDAEKERHLLNKFERLRQINRWIAICC